MKLRFLLITTLLIPALCSAADLKITDSELRVEPDDSMIVGVSLKSAPGVSIDPSNVVVALLVYDQQTDGKIVASESPAKSVWLTPPVDWMENAPERADLKFAGPADGSNKIYYGYTLGVYYKKQLIDSRYSTPDLEKKFPLPATR